MMTLMAHPTSSAVMVAWAHFARLQQGEDRINKIVLCKMGVVAESLKPAVELAGRGAGAETELELGVSVVAKPLNDARVRRI